jgi:hypothetical protein
LTRQPLAARSKASDDAPTHKEKQWIAFGSLLVMTRQVVVTVAGCLLATTEHASATTKR